MRILNRFYSEKMLFENGNYIMMWDLVAELRLRAREMDCLTKLLGTYTATLTAFLLSATETNPLELHYLCPVCKKVEFIKDKALPWDLPDKLCECGGVMSADGFDIPKEMCVKRKFGPWPHLAVNSAFMESAEEIVREKMGGLYRICKLTKPEFDILELVFLPFNGECDFEENVDTVNDRYDSYPKITITSSLAFDSAKEQADAVGIGFEKVCKRVSGRRFWDLRIIGAFRNGDVDGKPDFTSKMKAEMQLASPKNYYDLLQFMGAMHGTNTWCDNAECLIRDGICSIADIPTHRDDVFMLLRDKLREAGHTDIGIAYNISTKIRLGAYARAGISAEDRALLEYLDLPEWFIPYAEKIEYMFPKAHNVESLRIALAFMWYKINYPEEFEIKL